VRASSRRPARAADYVISWGVGGFLALVALGERSEHSGLVLAAVQGAALRWRQTRPEAVMAGFGPLVFLPTAAQDLDAGDVAAGDAVLLAPGLAVLLLLAWIGAAFAAGAALLRRRDLN
jgi:hypothetical protein